MNSSSTSVANAVRKSVDTGAQQILRVGQGEDVRDHTKPVCVGLVDDGPVQGRRQLRDRAVAVVHPDLDDVDLPAGELAHRIARLHFARHAIRSIPPVFRARAGIRQRDASAGGAEERRSIGRRRSQLVRQVAAIDAHAQGSRDSVVRVPAQMVDECSAGVVRRRGGHRRDVGVAKVAVGVDERRDDGLAGEIDPPCPLRGLHVALAAYV
jgi:hypothetical protein